METERIGRLTEQQRVCLRMVYSHLTSKEIAPRLGIEPNSVDQHIKAAMRTLGVSDRRTAALMLAQYEGRPAAVEMREVQAPYRAFPKTRTGGFFSLRPRLRWLRRASLAIVGLIGVLLAIGIVLAAVQAWLKIFGI